ncbi:MAG: pentapeptide repeat-containing protein, partial [Lachnospiraceae bacterium]
MNIKEILILHEKWLKGEPGGICANLSDANLSDANLSDANLRGANL